MKQSLRYFLSAIFAFAGAPVQMSGIRWSTSILPIYEEEVTPTSFAAAVDTALGGITVDVGWLSVTGLRTRNRDAGEEQQDLKVSS